MPPTATARPRPPTPTPTLPLCILDLVLSLAPRFLDPDNNDNTDNDRGPFNASLSLLRVLPPATIPSAYAAIFCAVNTGADCTLYQPGPDRFLDLYTVCKLRSTEALWALVQRWPLRKWINASPESAVFLFCCRLADALCYRGQLAVLQKMHAGGFDFARLGVRMFDSASESGHVDVLDWLASIDLGSTRTTFSSQAVVSASMNNHVRVLDWWAKTSLPLYALTFDQRKAIKHGCRHGSLGVLRYWFARGAATFEVCHWAEACEHGHAHVLEWVLRNADRYDIEWPTRELASVPTPMDIASEMGHIKCLSWFTMNSPAIAYSVHAMDMASERGKLDVLQWWAQSGLDMKFTPAGHRAALARGDDAIVQWWDKCTRFRLMRFGNTHLGPATAGNSRISTDPVMLAAFGRLEWMPTLSSLAAEPDHVLSHMRCAAAQHGHVHVLDRYRSLFRKLHINHSTLVAAALNDQLAALEWLVRNTSTTVMPSSDVWEDVLVEAARDGAYLAVDWILEYVDALVLEFRKRECMPRLVQSAAEAGRVNVLDVLVGKGGAQMEPYDDELDVLSVAAAEGHVGVFAWWKDRGYAFPDALERPMELACIYDHVELVRWNVEAGKVLPLTQRALRLARSNGSMDVMRYCLGEGRVELPEYLRDQFRSDLYPDSDEDDY